MASARKRTYAPARVPSAPSPTRRRSEQQKQIIPPKTRQASSDSHRPRCKERRNIVAGQAHIRSTFNDTIVSITDPNDAIIASCSSGQAGFRGSRKSTPYTTQLTAKNTARTAVEHGMKKIDVFVKGPGFSRETAIHSLTASDLEVTSIFDVMLRAYNGCRPPKRRRV